MKCSSPYTFTRFPFSSLTWLVCSAANSSDNCYDCPRRLPFRARLNAVQLAPAPKWELARNAQLPTANPGCPEYWALPVGVLQHALALRLRGWPSSAVLVIENRCKPAVYPPLPLEEMQFSVRGPYTDNSFLPLAYSEQLFTLGKLVDALPERDELPADVRVSMSDMAALDVPDVDEANELNAVQQPADTSKPEPTDTAGSGEQFEGLPAPIVTTDLKIWTERQLLRGGLDIWYFTVEKVDNGPAVADCIRITRREPRGPIGAVELWPTLLPWGDLKGEKLVPGWDVMSLTTKTTSPHSGSEFLWTDESEHVCGVPTYANALAEAVAELLRMSMASNYPDAIYPPMPLPRGADPEQDAADDKFDVDDIVF
jgi:hypothetical protein